MKKMKTFLTLILSILTTFIFAQNPVANFSASSTSVCLGSAIQFTDESTGNGINSYSWNFGNGETSTQQNPNYTYPAAGTYTVTLTVQTSGGQADAEVKVGYITINDAPHPQFSTSGNSCTVPISITFVNQTPSATNVDFSWDFGNGQTSTSANPNPVTYSSVGTYNVSLHATDTVTGCSATFNQAINISNFQADFSAPTTICVGGQATFTDQSTAGANSWQWNAGTAGNSSEQNPTFTFTQPGTYTISLTSMNTTSGCQSAVTKTVQVVQAQTPSFFASDSTGCSPITVQFTNTTGAAGTYEWNFGDGTNFSGQNPTPHQYTGNGNYTVTLAFTDANGCQSSTTKNAYINISSIEADFSAIPLNGCEPLDVVFSDSSTTPNSTNSAITSWNWNFGNGQTSTSQTPPMQTYNEGVYDVSLIITTVNGCKDTIVRPGYIKVGTKQQAGFTYNPTSSCIKTDIHFHNTSVIDPEVDTNDIVWHWDFGGDGTSSEKNPTHSFTTDTGYFDVTLVVDYRGCNDTMKIDSAIYIKAPVSQYYLQQELFCNPTFPVTVQTVDTSKLGVSTDLIDVYWKWGDGTTTHLGNSELHDSDKSASSHQYSNYGTYTVRQIIENHTTGCVDSLDKSVSISAISAGMSLVDSVCKGSQLSIDGSSATSTDPINDWSYNMGDMGTTSGNPATYAYQTSGTYTVTQTVTNAVGCTATTSKPIVSLELPTASFSAIPNAGCAPFVLNINNTSHANGNGVPMTDFTWTNTEDNSTQVTHSVSQNPNFVFNSNGQFTLALVVTDAFGCQSSPDSNTVQVTKPTADFSIDSVICNATDFEAMNNSTGEQLLTYQWIVDGSNISTATNLTTQLQDASGALSTNHTITLITIDVNGCKDTLSKTVKMSSPQPFFTYAPQGASVDQNGAYNCPPVFMDYTDQSTSMGAITNWQWDFFDNGNMSTNQNPSNTFVFPGTYSTKLTVTDEYGCTADTTLTDILTIHGPIAHPFYVQPNAQCSQLVTFDLGQNSDIVYVDWSFDDGNHVYDTNHYSYNYMNPGTYNPTVTVKDASDCEVVYPLDPITITPNGLTANFTYSPTEVELGNTVVFTDHSTTTGSPIASWTWTIGQDTYVNSTNEDVSQYMGTPGYYGVTLVVTNQDGCKATYTDSILVDVRLVVPNVFTPNGDGVNDYLTLTYNMFKSFSITILNRWGDVVYANDSKQGLILWDGRTQFGKPCSDGVYFYVLKGILLDGVNTKEAKGFVHLFGPK